MFLLTSYLFFGENRSLKDNKLFPHIKPTEPPTTAINDPVEDVQQHETPVSSQIEPQEAGRVDGKEKIENGFASIKKCTDVENNGIK